MIINRELKQNSILFYGGKISIANKTINERGYNRCDGCCYDDYGCIFMNKDNETIPGLPCQDDRNPSYFNDNIDNYIFKNITNEL